MMFLSYLSLEKTRMVQKETILAIALSNFDPVR